MSSIKVVQTADGSHTLFSEKFNAYYHSTNGAVQESRHVFIKCGFDSCDQDEINLLEIGFGTGLNAALTTLRAIAKGLKTNYLGIDLYPPDIETLLQLNYKSFLSIAEFDAWEKIVSIKWGVNSCINSFFKLEKRMVDFFDIHLNYNFDLIYFDAFAPNDQPDMWAPLNFRKLYQSTAKNGVLVTYCSKGIVKQALRDAGYFVERLPGPPGKRHILKATKR
jgi:tRNA U34 5-methylaminomethyl-2-thiouridine-forming methyltransferase MnmC